MSNTTTEAPITFGSPEFWTFYDEFCGPESLLKLVTERDYPLAKKMRIITTAAHKTREIHSLTRPERQWTGHNAWLVLNGAMIQNMDGNYGMDVQAGDVMVLEHGWDRDVFVTHCPINRNVVSGYFLSGKWEQMIGLFLPLFSQETILCAARLRLAQNLRDAEALLETEAEDWRWEQQP